MIALSWRWRDIIDDRMGLNAIKVKRAIDGDEAEMNISELTYLALQLR